MKILKMLIPVALVTLAIGTGAKDVLAQASTSVLYVPLIGLTSVPSPLSLPGPGDVTYNYAVKNFLREVPLTDIKVVDNNCNPINFSTGDDNNDGELDYGETWRYFCIASLSRTTQSIAIASGQANDTTATHKAYATVVVGLNDPAPLVSIINVTKVAYPLSLPAEGGKITFTYRVSNPGIAPLADVTVIDNKCNSLAGKLGDTNGNNLLDSHEVWIYTCTAHLTETTTNTVNVTAFANGLKAVDEASLTVKVENSLALSIPNFPDTGTETNPDLKLPVWAVMSALLALLTLIFILTRRSNRLEGNKKQ